jgi:hypothetical protein
MPGFDPHDWYGFGDWRGGDPVDPNTVHLLRWGFLVALSACLASFAPPALMPAVLSMLLHLAALGSAVVAGLKEEPVDAPHFTSWDEAAASVALGLLLDILFPALLPAGAEVWP